MVAESLLMKLPQFNNDYELVKKKQSVRDIMKQIFLSHEEYEKQYDRIATDFVGGSDAQTFRNLFDFIKTKIRYVEEPEEVQVIQSPAALIETGQGDCKSFASFIGGVIDSLRRSGADIDFKYVFAGYGDTNHVFVEADAGGETFWIDPVLESFNQRTPEPITIRKFYRDMALYKLSGVPKDGGNGMGASAGEMQECMLPVESLDQQLIRLSKCSPLGGSVLVPANSNPELYDLPFTGELPMSAPVDAIKLNPGEPITMQPSPPLAPDNSVDNPTQVAKSLPEAAVPEKKGVVDWVKENPLIAAAIAGAIVLAISRRKSRR